MNLHCKIYEQESTERTEAEQAAWRSRAFPRVLAGRKHLLLCFLRALLFKLHRSPVEFGFLPSRRQ